MYDVENGGPIGWAQDATREMLTESGAARVHEDAVARRIVERTPLGAGDARTAIERCIRDGFLVAFGGELTSRYLTLPEWVSEEV
jgi:hypothetical protein